MGIHWVSQKTETNNKWWRFIMPDGGGGLPKQETPYKDLVAINVIESNVDTHLSFSVDCGKPILIYTRIGKYCHSVMPTDYNLPQ
jgi:hypothetical protein